MFRRDERHLIYGWSRGLQQRLSPHQRAPIGSQLLSVVYSRYGFTCCNDNNHAFVMMSSADEIIMQLWSTSAFRRHITLSNAEGILTAATTISSVRSVIVGGEQAPYRIIGSLAVWVKMIGACTWQLHCGFFNLVSIRLTHNSPPTCYLLLVTYLS